MDERITSQLDKAVRLLDEADADLSTLTEIQERLTAAAGEVGKLVNDRVRQLTEVAVAITRAVEEMTEQQISFNLQYLQMQNAMQNETRTYTAISNIMKTKHDTVKNSISNVR